MSNALAAGGSARTSFISWVVSTTVSCERGAGGVARTIEEMIVDHAGGLHVGVDNGRADETETAPLQIAAEGFGERRDAGT